MLKTIKTIKLFDLFNILIIKSVLSLNLNKPIFLDIHKYSIL